MISDRFIKEAIASLRLGLNARTPIQCQRLRVADALAADQVDVLAAREIIAALNEATVAHDAGKLDVCLALCEEAHSLVLR